MRIVMIADCFDACQQFSSRVPISMQVTIRQATLWSFSRCSLVYVFISSLSSAQAKRKISYRKQYPQSEWAWRQRVVIIMLLHATMYGRIQNGVRVTTISYLSTSNARIEFRTLFCSGLFFIKRFNVENCKKQNNVYSLNSSEALRGAVHN